MREIPLLHTDFLKMIKALPNPDTFEGGDMVSLPVTDTLTNQKRHFLFRLRKFCDENNKEHVYWTTNLNIAINQKETSHVDANVHS